ncbi:hypothetical protein OAN22_01450, partial [Alphaproteobacteria bacterium]|nr:hypothetical protein [Alphaproteobacteria bacterium]
DGTLVKRGGSGLMSQGTLPFLEQLVQKGAKVHLFSARKEYQREATQKELAGLGLRTAAATTTGTPDKTHYLRLIMVGGNKGEWLSNNKYILEGIKKACLVDDFNYQLSYVNSFFQSKSYIQFTPFYVGPPHHPGLPADLFDIKDVVPLHGKAMIQDTYNGTAFSVEPGASFRFTKDGQYFVCKKLTTGTEMLADALCGALGIPVLPAVMYRLVTHEGIPQGDLNRQGVFRVTPYLPGTSLGLTGTWADRLKVSKHLVAIALLRNWDIFNQGKGLWKSEAGEIYHLRNRGILTEEDPAVAENMISDLKRIWERVEKNDPPLDKLTNSSHFFGFITKEEIAAQVAEILSKKGSFFETYDRWINYLGGSNKETDRMRALLEARFESLQTFKK